MVVSIIFNIVASLFMIAMLGVLVRNIVNAYDKSWETLVADIIVILWWAVSLYAIWR